MFTESAEINPPNPENLNVDNDYNKYIEEFIISSKFPNKKIRSMQLIGKNLYRCLLCQTFITTPEVNTHLQDPIHKTRLIQPATKEMIDNYHKFWASNKKSTGVDQLFSFPVDLSFQVCIACDEVIRNHDFLSHVTLGRHNKNMVDQTHWAKSYPALLNTENLLRFVSDEVFNELILVKDKNSVVEINPLVERYFPEDGGEDKVIMQIAKDCFVCLICWLQSKVGDRKYNKAEMLAHVNTSSHYLNVQSRSFLQIVKNFHLIMSQRPSEVQLEQIYFRPAERTDHVHCIVCTRIIGVTSILDHVYGFKHTQNVNFWHSKCKLKKWNDFYLTNENCLELVYPPGLYDLILRTNPYDCKLKTIQKVGNELHRCLACSEQIEMNRIVSHITSKHHIKAIENMDKIFQPYNYYWKNVKENLPDILNYIPKDESSVGCLQCSKIISLENLPQHKHLKSGIDYYPLTLLQEMQKLEGKMSRNVQKISATEYRCLLCRIKITNLTTHIQTYAQHQLFILDPNFQTSLKYYHQFWADLPEYQIYQSEFYPNNSNTIICEPCGTIIANKTELIEHLKQPPHETPSSSNQKVEIVQDQATKKLKEAELVKYKKHKSLTQLKKIDNSLTFEDHQMNDELRHKIWKNVPVRYSIIKDYMYYVNGIFKCSVCDCTVKPEIIAIKLHVMTGEHQKNTKKYAPRFSIPWNQLRYKCFHCNTNYNNEVEWQLHLDTPGLQKLR